MREADSQQRIHYIGKPRALIALEPKQHGWERFGPDHTGEDKPTYIEGAWMTKHDGRYYLQYGGARHRVQRLRHRHLRRLTTRWARSNTRPITRWATSPAVSFTAQDTATHFRMSTATGGTPARRG